MSREIVKPPAVTGGYVSKPSITDRRKSMKYRIDTVSTSASGISYIQGVNKYPAKPAIYFTREAWVKQCYLVQQCTKEVGWFALVDHDPADNSFTITEIIIPAQTVSAAETDIGKEDLADAAMELIAQGKDTSKMYAWFHSHVNMGVTPSTQDEFQIEDILEDLADQPEVPAFIRGIQNKKGELKLDIYYVQHGIAYQNLNFNILHDDDPQWYVDIDAAIKAKVTEATYQYQSYNYAGYGGSQYNAGKSQSGNVNGYGLNKAANEDKKNHTGYDDYYGWNDLWSRYDDDEDDDWIANSSSHNPQKTILTPESQDWPELIPMVFTDKELFDMEIVYKTNHNEEVLLSPGGQLWVCDAAGDVYDYQEYTEIFGEIGETPKIMM